MIIGEIMRIISGKYKGKSIIGFDIVGTRPTMDRVKESLFAMIGNKAKTSICLDLFAGSGALGFEAISNGAKSCYFVDQNKKVIETLKQNQQQLKIDETIELLHLDYKQALKKFKEQNLKFDLIFLDPPYQDNLIQSSLNLLEEYHLLNDNAMIVCESETEQFNCNYYLFKNRKYGSKLIQIYIKNT